MRCVALALLVAAGTVAAQPPVHALPQLVEAARALAAREAGVDASAIAVISAEGVTWRDGSLGCPDPDRMYTQSLVPGYRIRLSHGGRTWDFHAGRRGRLAACPEGRSESPLPDASN